MERGVGSFKDYCVHWLWELAQTPLPTEKMSLTNWRLDDSNKGSVVDASTEVYRQQFSGGGASSSTALPEWNFDRVYSPKTNTQAIFDESVKKIVNMSLEGVQELGLGFL